jgi:DNA mismatch repair protein MutS
MAQMGSFVPAREARIGICDRVYCRVGASDNLARGESTFLVEMNETAYILHTATEKSLVIMDEVGRGTGTNDGLSIAWAVSEELLNRIKCRTLFATHYHELSLIHNPHMANRSMEVLDKNGEIIFLRKVREGPAAESYGIHVARLAGLSADVLKRAEAIMDRLKERDAGLRQTLAPEEVSQYETPANDKKDADAQAAFAAEGEKNSEIFHSAVLRELRFLDLNRITPLEALTLLGKLKEQLAGDTGILPPVGKTPVRQAAAKSKPHKSAEYERSAPSLFD